jgi:hypothetical protein
MSARAVLWISIAAALLRGAEPVSFERSVKPILQQRCQACHQGQAAGGKLTLTAYDGLLAGGTTGPAVKPGQPDASLLLQVVTGDKPRMPKAGAPLTPEQIAILRKWIEEGARNDSRAGGGSEVWWSLRPLQRPSVPKLGGAFVRTPVDAFLLQSMQARQLSPSPEADRRTLARRLYFDLLGLPPTPAEIDAFVADTSPEAYETLVDRLLASPRYGERWTRHWLDIVHYGDSHGYDKDKPRPNAWPYRDYVIASFNEDKPYARFVQEQIAGDVLFPDDPRAFPGIGFLAAGPWDFVGHQELREGTTDKENTRLLDRDDIVATTISTFNSMTAHCARCHNHKFDPIPQEDYYALQSIFAGIDRADRPYDDDPALHHRRQALLQQKRKLQLRLQPLLDKVEFAASPEIESLDTSIQDARLQIAHLGEPKTPADAELKKTLEARVAVERKRRQELVDAIVGAATYQSIEALKAEMKPVDEQLEALPKPKLVYSGAGFFTRAGTFRPSLEPRPIFLLARGSVQSPGKPAAPGALTCVPLENRFRLEDPADEGSRRAALAKWITDSRNMLTWRSIVNRVWSYHFGTGIVDSPSDFGRMGSLPSHPELLDWLAVWFRDDAQGSLKKLHKLIVTSAAYRQSSASREDGMRLDAENRLLWRMNRMRLDAESVRDAALSAAGKLDLTMGGPAVQWFFFKDDHSPVYDYTRFDPDGPGAYRRSIYRFIVRSVPDPFMERLDCPDPSVLTPKRSTTITAIQALATLNNPFMVRMSEHFAGRIRGMSTAPEQQVALATRIALGRPPTVEEQRAYQDYASRYGLENLCRLLFNTNEFMFID